MPPEGLESSVDGLGRPVRAVGVVEEREDVRHAAFEGASERDESGASGRRSPDSEGFDELGHHAPSLPTVLLRVAGDDLLVDAVREGERLVGRVAKQLVGAFLLSVGPETGGLEQDPPAPIERIGPGAAPAGGLALEPAAHGRDLVAGELDDVERVEDLHGMRHLTCGGLLVARERIHRDRLHLLAERLRALGEPLGERLLASALDHVEQSGRPTMPTRGEVHDDGHVPAARTGVPPHVPVHADRLHAVQPAQVGGQHVRALLQHGPVQHAPRAVQVTGACEHALRLEHDLGNGPPHGRVRQTSALVGHMGQVVGPRCVLSSWSRPFRRFF